MDETQVVSRLYVPYCIEGDGSSQQISTALSLDLGKNLCLNHFLTCCRTVKQRLLPGQGAEVAAVRLDMLSLTWSPSSTGIYEGRPAGCSPAILAMMTSATYQLRPMG